MPKRDERLTEAMGELCKAIRVIGLAQLSGVQGKHVLEEMDEHLDKARELVGAGEDIDG